MNDTSRGLLIGTGGLLAGFFASELVDWDTAERASLAVVVTIAVSLVLWFVMKQWRQGV